MFRNTLFAKLFLLLIVAAVLLVPGIYYFTIPVVDQHLYEVEQHSGKITLDTIYRLLKHTQQDLTAWEHYSLEKHKQSLSDIVGIASSSLQRIRTKYDQGALTLDEARKEVFAEIRGFRYANNNYLYLCDYDATFIYHPDSKLNGISGANLKDVNGQLILPPMIDKARVEGFGYYDYWWHRLGEEAPMHKLTYVQDLPDWGWVVCSGVDLEDVARETVARKEELLKSLREFVRSTRIAENGYLYVFDGDLNMIIHPNSNIEKTNFSTLQNPVTGKLIGEELMAAAHNSDNRLVYKWDKPTDPDNYVYDKLAWVRYFPPYDYYVASSVYLDDLQSSGKLLARRLFHVAVFTIFILTVLGGALIYNVTSAVKKLALVANKVVGGDLTEQVVVDRDDEIGQLGHSFNLMVDKLKDQIDTLEARVVERTAGQTLLVDQLEQNNIETTMLKNANEMLQECRNEEEVYQAVRIIMKRAFPKTSGSIFSLDPDGRWLEIVSDWNCVSGNIGRNYPYDACFALRRGSVYLFDGGEGTLPCPHLDGNDTVLSVCTPITAYGDTFGILHIQHEIVAIESLARLVNVVEDVAEYIASTLANLRLRVRLQQQSIRDPLTGLFNRRYMDEILRQEESRAIRNGSQVGIIMMDIDYFKQFNDNYGHQAGDEVLRVLGKIIYQHFRESDVACRYGGEEFIVIMPDISLAQCQEKAEQLRRVVETGDYVLPSNEKISITLSLGVALFPRHGDELYSVLRLADDALYQAKRDGRNRVVCA